MKKIALVPDRNALLYMRISSPKNWKCFAGKKIIYTIAQCISGIPNLEQVF